MGGKARPARRPPERRLILRACPRVAPLGWPNEIIHGTVLYQWVVVKADGSGWTTGAIHDNVEHAFPESRLDDVLEKFYENAGPYPFDFAVTVVA